MLSLFLLAALFAAVAALCVAMSSPAEARPGARKHHHSHRNHVAHRHRAAIGSDEEDVGLFSVATGNVSRVSTARRFLGATARQLGLPRRLWCADFMNLVERRLGRRGTGSRLAMSFAGYGRRLAGPAVGAIATMGRRGGGHVGVVSGWDASTLRSSAAITSAPSAKQGIRAGVSDRTRCEADKGSAMRVKIGSQWFQAEPGRPLLIELDDGDKALIRDMDPRSHQLAYFNDSGMTVEQKLAWMREV